VTQLVDDYREYTRSFVDVHDDRIRAHAAERMAAGYQWPDPWVSLNPNFAAGGTVTELVAEDLRCCARLRSGRAGLERLARDFQRSAQRSETSAVMACIVSSKYSRRPM
jgi:hypothetical protein